MIADQSFSHQVIILLILTTFSFDYVLILLGENWLWSLLGLKGLTQFWIIDEFEKYSQTSTNGHLSTATNFFDQADSPCAH